MKRKYYILGLLVTLCLQELLNTFVEIAPSPRPVKAEERDVQPDEQKFTGFVFKITANIDLNHRSCIASDEAEAARQGYRPIDGRRGSPVVRQPVQWS